MSSALSHQHEKNHGIIAAERSQKKKEIAENSGRLKISPSSFPFLTTHWGYCTKKKAFFSEKAANLCTKIIFFYPDTFG